MPCGKFGLSFRDVKLAYREHRDSHGASSSTNIKTLLNCVSTIPVSTAACERGFSKMNVMCSSLRSRLTVSHISSLMFISLCGPPLHIWQPVTCQIMACFEQGASRLKLCTQCPERSISIHHASDGMKSLWDILCIVVTRCL